VAVALLGIPAVPLVLAAAPVPAGAASRVQAFVTLYGYVDNSPPGRAIAHPCIHRHAGGTGTFADPVTFATDVQELGWCTRIYVPYLRRYFVHEDECTECDRSWRRLHRYRFDAWAGGDARSLDQPERGALLACESRWTRGSSIRDPANPEVLVDPPANLPVTAAPLFRPPTTCWSGR